MHNKLELEDWLFKHKMAKGRRGTVGVELSLAAPSGACTSGEWDLKYLLWGLKVLIACRDYYDFENTNISNKYAGTIFIYNGSYIYQLKWKLHPSFYILCPKGNQDFDNRQNL